jgi:hypothetical protein
METLTRKNRAIPGMGVTVHRMGPLDTEGVRQLMREVYWDPCSWKYVYNSPQSPTLNPAEERFPLVAAGPDGSIIGYAMVRSYPGYASIGQLASLVVSPCFTGQGLLSVILRYLAASCGTGGFRSITAGVSTAHPPCLWGFQRQGFHASAIQFEPQPGAISFETLTGARKAAPAIKILTAVLSDEGSGLQYLPDRHRQIILETCGELGISIIPGAEGPMGNDPTGIECACEKKTGTGSIWIRNAGPDYDRVLEEAVRDLQKRGARVIRLHLDLSDPGSREVAAAAKEAGFVFSGILPGENGLILILQHLQGVAATAAGTPMGSPFGDRLLSYIQSSCPHQRGALPFLDRIE